MRKHFALAKIGRARLTEQTATTMQINFRSWRDTGITWLALAGVDIAKMQRRAGHDEISTTLGYVKMAEDLTGSIGEPFPVLPAALLEEFEGSRTARSHEGQSGQVTETAAKPLQKQRRGRDSNQPRSRRVDDYRGFMRARSAGSGRGARVDHT